MSRYVPHVPLALKGGSDDRDAEILDG